MCPPELPGRRVSNKPQLALVAMMLVRDVLGVESDRDAMFGKDGRVARPRAHVRVEGMPVHAAVRDLIRTLHEPRNHVLQGRVEMESGCRPAGYRCCRCHRWSTTLWEVDEKCRARFERYHARRRFPTACCSCSLNVCNKSTRAAAHCHHDQSADMRPRAYQFHVHVRYAAV